jgi:hypothetical protein
MVDLRRAPVVVPHARRLKKVMFRELGILEPQLLGQRVLERLIGSLDLGPEALGLAGAPLSEGRSA